MVDGGAPAHVDRVQIIMARDSFPEIAPLLDAALGSTLDTPLGHVLGDYMMALEHRLPAIEGADLPRLQGAVAAMVGAAVAPTADRVAVARRQIDLGRMERVRQIVRRHLRTPTLGPQTLCRLAGMSRSNLYRLFDGTGGVAQYIQKQRLLAAHIALTDPASPTTISVLAEDFCFADASSFSRAFKREFGNSPSEVGAAGRSAGWRRQGRRCREGIRNDRISAGCCTDFSGINRRSLPRHAPDIPEQDFGHSIGQEPFRFFTRLAENGTLGPAVGIPG